MDGGIRDGEIGDGEIKEGGCEYTFHCLKVHKNENFFGFDFEICTFS